MVGWSDFAILGALSLAMSFIWLPFVIGAYLEGWWRVRHGRSEPREAGAGEAQRIQALHPFPRM